MFGHLLVKSAYSFQKSTILIKDLVRTAKQKNIKALALVDDDNMYATYEFYEECLKNDIKPILGVNASIKIEQEIYPFTLLAKDDIGYFDLIRIVSDINTSEEFCLSLEGLSLYKEHLFIIASSDQNIIQRSIEKELEPEADKYIKLFKQTFKENFYIMICRHKLGKQEEMNRKLIHLAGLRNVPVIFGNDVCYLRSQDALAVDLMKASSNGDTLNMNHMPITSEKYLKSQEEMERLFTQDIIDNTYYVVDTCKTTIPQDIKNLPYYPIQKGNTKDYLYRLCLVGLKKRFKGKEISKDYFKRLEYELKMIDKMGFNDYFLIVYDYVQFARKNGILVGPGRGSAAGSLVAYVLGITNVDPLEYDLLFERFLNPERVSMPDIDIDFQDDRRDEVIQYVIDKYEQEHAASIVTFSTYGPRNAIKDIGKVMNVPLPRLEMIAKMIPTGYRNKKTITEVYQTSASFQSLINENPALKKMIGAMSTIEHLPRNISMHAAGVVLSQKPLRDVVPLVIGPSSMMMTQYSKNYIEKAGLLKMDFLGLKNLTMIDYILKDIKTYTHQNIVLNDIPFDDKDTYELLSKGDTFGVFQLESNGMRNLLRELKPYQFEDIVAAIALYRPGPMENIPTFLNRRFKKEEITYIVPELEPILSSTFGIIVYQEQIMQIATTIAGFSLGKADILRKAVSKKDANIMTSIEEEFIQGAISKGYSKDIAKEIYDLIEKFANYGFNKSHSVAYSVIAYQLAYLKVHYPLYFYASILSNEGASLNTKIQCIEESKHHGIKVLPPSINYSKDRFNVENGSIRYSLLSIKNVGYRGYQEIEKEREKGLFKDILDFLERMISTRLSSKMLESLIDAGAFDEFEDNRAYIKENMPILLEYVNLHDTLDVKDKPRLKSIKENRYERLEKEKDVLGLYISKHPISYMKERIHLPITNISQINDHMKNIYILMNITKTRIIVDKRGNEMAFIEGQDDTGSIECVCFSSTYSKYKQLLHRGNNVILSCRIQKRDQLSLIINQVKEVK